MNQLHISSAILTGKLLPEVKDTMHEQSIKTNLLPTQLGSTIVEH